MHMRIGGFRGRRSHYGHIQYMFVHAASGLIYHFVLKSTVFLLSLAFINILNSYKYMLRVPVQRP